ncbi:hypothetical protein J2T10_000112 [Paenarthrobacter nicotinovorans]|uniref:Uncharacterized protein n=1 Tax=Paenarthrobacter nicotinovorans TaxID=29320 RepID=A0ABT9TFR8_PAENI|nr:hypothetical protein [Paenarthrobacter nicotinovorans]
MRSEPRDWFYYADREAAEEQQQTRMEDDADSVRKGER